MRISCSHVGLLDFLHGFHVECGDGVGILLVGHFHRLAVDKVVHFAGLDVLVSGHGLVESGKPPLLQVGSTVESSRVILQLAAAGEHQTAEESHNQRGEAGHHHGDGERFGRVDADDRLRGSDFGFGGFR